MVECCGHIDLGSLSYLVHLASALLIGCCCGVAIWAWRRCRSKGGRVA